MSSQPVDDRNHFDISTPMEISPNVALRALGALAQEHRLEVYRLLVQAGPDGLAAGALAGALDIPASSMSFHLAQLANAGLVSQRRQSRSIIYSADYDAMNRLMGFLTENCCGGENCGAAAICVPKSNPTTQVA